MKFRASQFFSAAVAGICIFSASQGRAEVREVPSLYYDTINQAIGASMDGDEVLVHPGTYQEAINFLGKAIWVHSSGGPDVTTISGESLNLPVVKFVLGEEADSILEGFTITLGSVPLAGGGIHIHGADPTIMNCKIVGNAATNGGGLSIVDSSATLTGCLIDGNTATNHGGGAHVSLSTAELIDCTFSSNSASMGGGLYSYISSHTVTGGVFSSNTANQGTLRYGGAVANAAGGIPAYIDCEFTGNTAYRGAGMSNETCSPELTGCSFSGNSANQRGGAIYNVGDAHPGTGQSNPVLTACEFTANSAPWGGAMANDAREAPVSVYGPGSEPSLYDCLFLDNSSTDRGGAMWADQFSDAYLEGCVFISNSASNWGGGMYNETASQPTLIGCSFIGNYAGHGGALHNRVNSSGHYIDCEFTGNAAGGNGGAFYEFSLGRPSLTGCTFTANNAANGGAIFAEADSGPALTECTFSDNRSTYNGGAIHALDGYTTVTDCSFIGNRAHDDGGAIRVDRISSVLPPGHTHALEVTGTTFRGNWTNDVYGGAVLVTDNSSASFAASEFVENMATHGGALCFYGNSTGTVTGCSFNGNTAWGYGGAIEFDYSGATIDLCTFSYNWANNSGGALWQHHGAPIVKNCLFTDNSAWEHGGAIGNNGTPGAIVANSTFSGNVARLNGGAIYNTASTPAYINLLLVDNSASYGGAMLSVGGSTVLDCSTLYSNAAWTTGHGLYNNGTVTVTNSILWDYPGVEIHVAGGSTTVDYSTVRGGWTGAGVGVIDADPQFVDVSTDDFRLLATSPARDGGLEAMALPDLADLNNNGDTGEPCPYDRGGSTRISGTPLLLDMGAYEFQETCPEDTDGNWTVDTVDLVNVILAWDTYNPPADNNGDGTVDVVDLVNLVLAWGDC